MHTKVCVYTQHSHGQTKFAVLVLVCIIIAIELLNSAEQNLGLPLKRKRQCFEISFHTQQMHLQKKVLANQDCFLFYFGEALIQSVRDESLGTATAAD